MIGDLGRSPIYKILVILEQSICSILTKSLKSYTLFSISIVRGGWFIWEELRTGKLSNVIKIIYRTLKYNCDITYNDKFKADLNWELNTVCT